MNADRIPSIQLPLISMPGWVVRGYVESGDVLVQCLKNGAFIHGKVFIAAMAVADIGRYRFSDGPVTFEILDGSCVDAAADDYFFRVSVDPRDRPDRQMDTTIPAHAITEIYRAVVSVLDKLDQLVAEPNAASTARAPTA